MPDPIYNPFTGQDEIVFKDADGKLKTIRDGKVVPLESASLVQEAPVESDTAKPPLPSPTAEKVPVPDEQTLVKESSFQTVQAVPPPQASGIKQDQTAPKNYNLTDTMIDYDSIVDRIIADTRVSLSDDLLSKRFRNVVLSRLKDVRDKIEAKEILMRATENGGLGFSADAAENISDIIENHIQKVNEEMRNIISKKVDELQVNVERMFDPQMVAPRIIFDQVKDTPYYIARKNEDVPPVPKPILETGIPEKKFVSTAQEAVTPPKPAVESTIPPQPTEVPAERSVVLQELQKESIAQVPEQEGVSAPTTIKVEPVRFRPKLVGPVEELKEITIEDFRRLDANPINAAAKIMEKLNILEKESFGKKYSGIKNWRQSEVYKVYTEMGIESMEFKKPIPELIQIRQLQKKPVLTESEFMAVMDLNEKMRF